MLANIINFSAAAPRTIDNKIKQEHLLILWHFRMATDDITKGYHNLCDLCVEDANMPSLVYKAGAFCRVEFAPLGPFASAGKSSWLTFFAIELKLLCFLN